MLDNTTVGDGEATEPGAAAEAALDGAGGFEGDWALRGVGTADEGCCARTGLDGEPIAAAAAAAAAVATTFLAKFGEKTIRARFCRGVIRPKSDLLK